MQRQFISRFHIGLVTRTGPLIHEGLEINDTHIVQVTTANDRRT